MDLSAIGDINAIDWQRDDGVNIDMINDIARNRFYDSIMSHDIRGKRAVDIGFGTGLLTMLALKHGAQHVIAYEQDANRWRLGTNVICDLGLEDRIELRWSKFQHKDIKELTDRIFFTEVVNGNFFYEGLWNILPNEPKLDFRPSQYCLDLYAIDITLDLAHLLKNIPNQSQFHPGVETWPGFVDRINYYRSGSDPQQIDDSVHNGINEFECHSETVWGWIPHMKIIHLYSPVAGYCLDATQNTLSTWNDQDKAIVPRDHDIKDITVEINVMAQNHRCQLIVPRTSMCYNGQKLYLDQSHWGPVQSPVIIKDFVGKVAVCHDVRTGDISYSLC